MSTALHSDRSAQKSVLFWISDYLKSFCSVSGNRDFSISAESSKRFGIRKSEKNLSAGLSAEMIFLKRRSAEELVRKAGVKLGLVHDSISIDQERVVRKILRIRAAARRALSINAEEPSCRFLLRIDDFPAPSSSSRNFLRVHEIFKKRGISYLLAVTPFFSRAENNGFLTDEEIEILKTCKNEGAAMALHGFTHSKNASRPNSELSGMPLSEFKIWLTKAKTALGRHDLHPMAFVAPFNSYDPISTPELTSQFTFLCGGPESVHCLGYRIGPAFLGESLYLPSYRGAYDIHSGNLQRLRELGARARGLVIPVTIHWANGERDNFRGFEELARFLEGKTINWNAYAGEIRESTAFLRARGAL